MNEKIKRFKMSQLVASHRSRGPSQALVMMSVNVNKERDSHTILFSVAEPLFIKLGWDRGCNVDVDINDRDTTMFVSIGGRSINSSSNNSSRVYVRYSIRSGLSPFKGTNGMLVCTSVEIEDGLLAFVIPEECLVGGDNE